MGHSGPPPDLNSRSGDFLHDARGLARSRPTRAWTAQQRPASKARSGATKCNSASVYADSAPSLHYLHFGVGTVDMRACAHVTCFVSHATLSQVEVLVASPTWMQI